METRFGNCRLHWRHASVPAAQSSMTPIAIYHRPVDASSASSLSAACQAILKLTPETTLKLTHPRGRPVAGSFLSASRQGGATSCLNV
jgi:hypothetical protein